MGLLVSVGIALRAIRVNKLRSTLTMLGIAIGVGAVIAMISLGAGATQRINDYIKSIGSNLIMVQPGVVTSGGVRMGLGSKVGLTEDDARAIELEVPGVLTAGGEVWGTTQTAFGNRNWSTVLLGVTECHANGRDWEVAEGRFIAREDVSGATKVVVLGQTVKENLFGDDDALGEIVRIKRIPFTVIGVLSRKGQSVTGWDQDDGIFIPLSTAKMRVLGVSKANARSVRVIQVKVASAELIPEVEQQVTHLLRHRHRLQPHEENDFQIRILADSYAAQKAASKTMTLLLGAIASVSLLVGGVGIMNIMLVSVTERTREIGLRMAVGARVGDILKQFFVEALTLALIGGILGIAVGVIGSILLASLWEWPTLITPDSIVLAFGSAALIGATFGYYPARKAAHLNPITALQWE